MDRHPMIQPSADFPSQKENYIFATTRWSLILRAKEDNGNGQAALETLCRAYWHPLRSYLLRAGYNHPDAEDFTQEFFAQLLRRGSFAKVTPERGRFRNFLLVSLRNFLADQNDKVRALRRGGGLSPVSLDGENPENNSALVFSDSFTTEHFFDRKWAETVLARAREKLRAECSTDHKISLYESLGPEGNDSDETYAEIGTRLGLSEDGIKSAAFRLRRRYRELIRAEVAETVSSESELEEELRHLLRALEI